MRSVIKYATTRAGGHRGVLDVAAVVGQHPGAATIPERSRRNTEHG